MMRKNLVFILALGMLVLTNANPVLADEFSESSNYHAYQGGYTTQTRSHWTLYKLKNAPYLTVGAGIRVLDYTTEVKVGQSGARIDSKHNVGPYVRHTHYRYDF